MILYMISYIISHNIEWGKLHLRGYQIAKQKRKVQEQDPNPITSQMLPGVTLNIHVIEVGCILSGPFDKRRQRVQR
jgi:hypothetical protein